MRATLDLAKAMGSDITRQQEMRKARGAMLFQSPWIPFSGTTKSPGKNNPGGALRNTLDFWPAAYDPTIPDQIIAVSDADSFSGVSLVGGGLVVLAGIGVFYGYRRRQQGR